LVDQSEGEIATIEYTFQIQLMTHIAEKFEITPKSKKRKRSRSKSKSKTETDSRISSQPGKKEKIEEAANAPTGSTPSSNEIPGLDDSVICLDSD